VSKVSYESMDLRLNVLVPAVPSCLRLEAGPSRPMADFSEQALQNVGKKYTEDLLAKRKEQLAAMEKNKAKNKPK